MTEYSPEALFRFRLVSEVLGLERTWKSRADAIEEVAQRSHTTFEGHCRLVSSRTLYRWLKLFEEKGTGGLEKAARPVVVSAVLPEAFLGFLKKEKKLDRKASIPELIDRAREKGVLAEDAIIDRTTVYRTCVRLGVQVARVRGSRDDDARRFAFPHRLDMILADGKHFRAGATRAKRVALFFLDDCTRFPLNVVVGTSESAELFLEGLYGVISTHGLPSTVFLDQGPGFISKDSYAVASNLGFPLIYGTKAYPEGHGKIEKFIQFVLHRHLRSLDRQPDVDPDCGSLEGRIRHFLENKYYERPHESLGGKTPFLSFISDPKPLKHMASHKELDEKFVIHIRRRVSGDNIVSVDSILYEMPRGYRGIKVILRLKLLHSRRVLFLHEGRWIELHPVDLHANARHRRARRPQAEEEIHPPRKTAADHAYERDLGPVVDPEEGCPEKESDK